jgi:Predicted 3'-5' exonuclease related to the exonuclease domain of PolB
VREGRIGEMAAYCETDVVSTYRVWLVHAQAAPSNLKFEHGVSLGGICSFFVRSIDCRLCVTALASFLLLMDLDCKNQDA